jgi:hypothetical protein
LFTGDPSHQHKQAVTKSERLEGDLPSQWPLKTGVAILTSDKVDFKLTLIKWDKEGHFILIQSEMHQKEITTINLYAPNVSAPSFIKLTLKDLKAHIDSNTVVVLILPYHQ